jgi:hypothetical protein
LHLNKELNRHAAAADIYAMQGKDDLALAEFKVAVASWSMANDVKGER